MNEDVKPVAVVESFLDAIKATTEEHEPESSSVKVKGTLTVENNILVFRAPINNMPPIETVKTKATVYERKDGSKNTVRTGNVCFQATMPEGLMFEFKTKDGKAYKVPAIVRGMVHSVKNINIGFNVSNAQEVKQPAKA